jgi:hypothetical protein
VRVVAEDSKSNPITNLRRQDFEIASDGEPQPLSFFTAAKSNAPEGPGYAVIILDWLNSSFQDRVLVDHRLSDGQEPRLLRDFTDDRDIRLESMQAAANEPVETDEELPKIATASAIEMQMFLWNRKVRASLHTFDVIAERLAHIHGRKTVIWLSAGFPMTIDSTVVKGAKPDSIDARGLTAGASRGFPTTLQELSLRTGGTAFVARNDLDTCIKRAFQDMDSAYVLGSNVPDGTALGSHKIRVRANRPGITLRYRESYLFDGR